MTFLLNGRKKCVLLKRKQVNCFLLFYWNGSGWQNPCLQIFKSEVFSCKENIQAMANVFPNLSQRNQALLSFVFVKSSPMALFQWQNIIFPTSKLQLYLWQIQSKLDVSFKITLCLADVKYYLASSLMEIENTFFYLRMEMALMKGSGVCLVYGRDHLYFLSRMHFRDFFYFWVILVLEVFLISDMKPYL